MNLIPYRILYRNFTSSSQKFQYFTILNYVPQYKLRSTSMFHSRHVNHYQVLGIKSSASEKDIKNAYFKLAKKYHPDLNPNPDARNKFESITKAYETLSDEAKREVYDNQMGYGKSKHQDFNYTQAAGARDRQGVYSDDEYENVNFDRRTKPFQSTENWKRDPNHTSEQFWKDVNEENNKQGSRREKENFAENVWDEFDDFFQFNDQSSFTRDDTKGADYKIDLEIELKDTIHGGVKKIEMNKRVICSTCRGMRAQKGSQPRKCFECGGRGTIIGNYGIKKKCQKCMGAGCIVRVPCDDCQGMGVQRQTLYEDIDIPKGLIDGQKIRMQSRGHASDIYSGVPGDLLLTVKVKQNDKFKCEGRNIIHELAISLSEAVLGGKFTIDTIDGKLNIEMKAGINDGDEFVIKNYGIPVFQPSENYDEHSLRGNFIVRFKVVMPRDLSKNQEKIINKFKESEDQNMKQYYESVKNDFISKQRLQDSQKQNQSQSSSNSQKQTQQQQNKNEQGGIFDKIKDIFN